MSKILITQPQGSRYVVSDTEYAGIDWGSSSNDVVQFETEDGGFISLQWKLIKAIVTDGRILPPGAHTGHRLRIAGAVDDHITEATKTNIIASLQGPGSDDQILFIPLESGEDVYVATRNVCHLEITSETLDIPVP